MVFALLLLPNLPQLDCRVSGLVTVVGGRTQQSACQILSKSMQYKWVLFNLFMNKMRKIKFSKKNNTFSGVNFITALLRRNSYFQEHPIFDMVRGGNEEGEEEEREGENYPYVWKHRSSTPLGPLPKKKENSRKSLMRCPEPWRDLQFNREPSLVSGWILHWIGIGINSSIMLIFSLPQISNFVVFLTMVPDQFWGQRELIWGLRRMTWGQRGLIQGRRELIWGLMGEGWKDGKRRNGKFSVWNHRSLAAQKVLTWRMLTIVAWALLSNT